MYGSKRPRHEGNDVRALPSRGGKRDPTQTEKTLAEPIHLGSTSTLTLPLHHPVHVNRQHPSRWPVRYPNRSVFRATTATSPEADFPTITDNPCSLQSPRTRPSTTAARRLTVTGSYPNSPVATPQHYIPMIKRDRFHSRNSSREGYMRAKSDTRHGCNERQQIDHFAKNPVVTRLSMALPAMGSLD